jgi:ABC-type bacteriocin/lantibiotic exporter with double-glycine peptidase domain
MEISLENISYHYDEVKLNLFEELSLRFSYGEKTAIVGRSGSGKSTLCKLLTRLVSPQQ